MLRAIFFDFYSVWAPDTIGTLLNEAEALGPQESAELATMVDHYYHGGVGATNLAHTFRWRLGRADVSEATLTLRESHALPDVISYMRSLHGHFLKLGILANLGTMESELLSHFNTAESLFEVIVSPLSLGASQPLLSREVFGSALKLIDEPAAACLAVSGNKDYLAFAAGLGMQSVAFISMDELSHTVEKLLAQDTPSSVNAPK